MIKTTCPDCEKEVTVSGINITIIGKPDGSHALTFECPNESHPVRKIIDGDGLV